MDVLNKLNELFFSVWKQGILGVDFFQIIVGARFLPIVLGVFFASYYMSFDNETRGFIDNVNRTLITILIFWIIHQIIEPISYILSGLDKVLTKELIGWIIKSLYKVS